MKGNKISKTGLISIASPLLLLILLLITTLFEQISRTNIFYALFSRLFLFWMFVGWLVGAVTGIISIAKSISSKEGGAVIGIIGLMVSLLWIAALLALYPLWMGI